MKSSCDNQAILVKLERLLSLFRAGKILKLHKHEVHPKLRKNLRENYLYFTLPVSINFQRNSAAMWNAALKTYQDKDTRYLFYPEKVISVSEKKVTHDLRKHSLSLLTNKHSQIWREICQTLADEYGSDPRNLLQEQEFKVNKILGLIRKKKKKSFPYLSGPKMSNYWLYILDQYTDAPLKNTELISIIPDTHIRKASSVLGITKYDDKPDFVAQKWFDLLKDSDIKPIDLHPVLWNWSRAGFKPELKVNQPN